MIAQAFLLTIPVLAQITDDDILLSCGWPYPGLSEIAQLHPDGTLVLSTNAGTGSEWGGVGLSVSGRIVNLRNMPRGFNLLDSSGVEVASHDIVGGTVGDVDVLHDGTLVLSLQGGGRLLFFSESGESVGVTTGLSQPLGVHVGARNTVWVCESPPNHPQLWGIKEYDRTGSFLRSFGTTFRPADLIEAPDQTLWIAGMENSEVYQTDFSGNVLRSWGGHLGASGLMGIGMSRDGSVVLTEPGSGKVSRYDQSGSPLGTFPVPCATIPFLLRVLLERPELGTRLCDPATPNSTSKPGRVTAIGSQTLAEGNFTLLATDLPLERNTGYFIMGQSATPFVPPGSAGPICIGSSFVRLLPPVLNTAINSGGFGLTVDTTGPIGGNITPGSTWGFQAWHRDSAAGISNLTDAVEVTFL